MAFDPALGRAFLFDETDLEHNRDGRLSSEQELLLRNTARGWSRHLTRGRWMLVIAMAVAVVVVLVGISATPGGGLVAAVVAGVILLWIGAIAAWAFRRGRRLVDAVGAARVHMVEGDLRVEPAYSGDHDWAYVGQVRFGIDRYQWDRLEDGARYRVHYVLMDGSVMPLSLERV